LPEFSDSSATAGPAGKPTDGPFGCATDEPTPYKHRRTAKDVVFEDFVNGVGNHPDVLFEVKTQIDNGPLISTKYYKLEFDQITEHPGPFFQKIHCFKDYKCAAKNLFFAVDLYRADQSGGGNFYHMRLNPYTKINDEILLEFFAAQ